MDKIPCAVDIDPDIHPSLEGRCSMDPAFLPDGRLRPSPLAPGLFTACLPSGLRVVILAEPRRQVAICNVWVKVGSNREPEALRGWSHGIEHMIFKGTRRRQESDFALEVAQAGGATNAGTGYETTNYYITVPAPEFPVTVDILGDALQEAVFAPAALDAERQVLVHENHLYDDIPFGFGITWRWAMELAFDRSPYRHPIGGRDVNLLERDREDILKFYRSAYRPDNMTVVVAGAVEPAAALELIRDRFGSSAPPPALPEDREVVMVEAPPLEPAHDGARLRLEKGDIQKAYAKLVFPGLAEGDPDRSAMSVARRILGDGRSSRLYRQVKEEAQLVDKFTLATEAGPREGVFIVDLDTDPERLAAALQAIAGVLQELKDTPCTETELARARVRVKRTFLFGKETVRGLAETLGYYEAVGDLAAAFETPDRIQRIGAENVSDVCRRLLRRDQLSCLIYLPAACEPGDHGIPTTAPQLEELLASALDSRPPEAKAAQVKQPSETPAARPPLAGDESAVAAGQGGFTVVRLDSGLEVCLRIDRSLPVVALTWLAAGGVVGETREQAGLTNLTGSVLVKGSGSRDAEQLHTALEGLGASLVPKVERDFLGVAMTCMTENIGQPLALVGELLCDPAFSAQEIALERKLAAQKLAGLADDTFQHAVLKVRELFYGDHAYSWPLLGTAASLPNLERKDLIQRFGRTWTTGNQCCVISGDIDPDQILAQLEEISHGLPSGEHCAPDFLNPGPVPPPAGVVTRRLQRDQNQSVVLVAWPGPADCNSDRIPLQLLKEVLNGQSGRLFDSLRNRRSLCYNTGVLSTEGFGPGMLLGYVLTSPDQEDEARQALIHELEILQEEQVPAEEFERARTQLLGNLVIGLQSNRSRANKTARDRIYGRSANDLPELLEAIRSCTAAQVQELANRFIGVKRRFELTTGPARPGEPG